MRYYGEQVRNEFYYRIDGLKRDLSENKDLGNINNFQYPTIPAEVSEARAAILSANYAINAVHQKLSDIMQTLSAFYEDTDAKLLGIEPKIASVVAKINNVNATIENMVTAVRGDGVFNGQPITADNVMMLCDPIKVDLKQSWLNLIKANKLTADKRKYYIAYLASIGIPGVTENKVKAYQLVFEKMSKLGFSDEAILNCTEMIYADPELEKLFNASDDKIAAYVDSNLESYFLGELQAAFGGVYNSDRYLPILAASLSNEDKILMMKSINASDEAFKGMDNEEQLEFMVRLALGGIGYHGDMGAKYPMSFFGGCYANYGKTETHWCAEFVTWCLSYAGFLNEGSSIIPGVNKDNAVDPYHCWAGQDFICDAFRREGKYAALDSGYIPAVGDLVECHCGGHICIVAGVDVENNCIYTIEGNNDNSINVGFYNLNEDLNRPGTDSDPNFFDDVLGFCKMGGTKRDMSMLTDDMIANKQYMDWNAHVVDKCYGGKSNDLPQFYLDRGFGVPEEEMPAEEFPIEEGNE